MKDLLFLDKMLTPKIITVVYWLLIIGSIVGGIGAMFGGYQGFTAEKFFVGILYLVGGLISARISSELLIVVFKINEALQEIRAKQP